MLGASGATVSTTIAAAFEAAVTEPSALSTFAVTSTEPSGNAAVGFKIQLPDLSAVNSGEVPSV